MNIKRVLLSVLLALLLVPALLIACGDDDDDNDDTGGTPEGCIICQTTSECMESFGPGWGCLDGCCEGPESDDDTADDDDTTDDDDASDDDTTDDDDDDDDDDVTELTATITEPEDNAVFGIGQMIQFRGTAIDPNHPNDDLDVEWESSIDLVLNSTPPAINGDLFFELDTLSAGQHQITLTVVNPDQQTDTDAINIEVTDYWYYIDPECAILSTGETLDLTAPGSEAPVTWSFVENNSGATMDASTGEYTAGSTAWTKDLVLATDVNNVKAYLLIHVVGTWVGSQLSMITGDAYTYSRSYRVSSNDYDFDQDIDFIVANIGSGYDRIFVNNGAGGFSVSEPFPLYASREIKFIDYDQDNDFDVAFGGSDSSASHLYENTGVGFTEVFNWGDSSEDCLGMAVGDLTGDGYPEIVCAHNQETHPVDMTILLNVPDVKGGRTFSQIYFGPDNHTSQALSLADVDDDGDLDLAAGGSYLTASTTPIQNLLCKNDGSANMTCANEFGTGRTNEVAFGDYDGDGDEDLLVSNTSEPLAIWWNDGAADPTFTEDQTVFDENINMGSVRQFGVGDVEAITGALDQDIDVLVAQGGGSATAILYLSNGDGSFCPYTIFDAAQSLSEKGIIASHFAKLNTEGWLDFVVTRYRDYNEVWMTQP